MNKKVSVKNICITAACIALGCVLPTAFHAVGLGSILSPMHIPVLLCGLVTGSSYGLICGIITPLLSSLITSMPGPAMLVSMVPELAVYGLVAGLMMRFVRTGKNIGDIYISLGTSMIAGRIVGGIAKALFFMGGGNFTIAMWLTGYFVEALPGIICHLLLLPVLVMTLERAKVIPKRYEKVTVHE